MPRRNGRKIYTRKLLQQTLRSIWEYSLTVVEAPMGYGKTTAVREYLGRSQGNMLWLTLTDHSALGFWKGFCRRLAEVNPEIGGKLEHMGIPGNMLFMEEAIEEIGKITFLEKTALVLDDYHLLVSKEIDAFLELLVKAEMPDLHIIILSRSVFGENMPELVMKGYCQIIRKNSFELSKDEIVEYCAMYGVNLEERDAAFLNSYTEGWISAIYLSILGFLQDGKMERQDGLYDLIESVVYRKYPEQVKLFLRNICVFDMFTLKQAEYMWQKGDAAEMLRQLTSENAFIRYDGITETYYMHNIFTGYLRRIFGRLEETERQRVWVLAGEWHVEMAEYSRAQECFFAGGDFEQLLTALEMDGGKSITNEHRNMLIRYFQECPETVLERHIPACLIYAINLFSYNEIQLFAEQCEKIGGYIAQLADDNPMKSQMNGELEILCSFSKYNHVMAMWEHIQQADKLLTGRTEFIDLEGSWTFGSPSVLYMFYREPGTLAKTVEDLYRAMPDYCRLTDGHGVGAEYIMAAERYYYMGDFENAEILSHRAMHAAKIKNQWATMLCVYFLQLRMAAMTGNSEYIEKQLHQPREELKSRGLYQYMHTWDMCEGWICAGLRQEQKIPSWILKNDLDESAIFFPTQGFYYIVWGRVLLAKGEYAKLLGLGEEFLQMGSIFPNILTQIYTYIYMAAAYEKMGRLEDADGVLEKGVALSAEDDLVMPFCEFGEYIKQILWRLSAQGRYAKFLARVAEFRSLTEKSREMVVEKLAKERHSLDLTERETAIAELVAEGLSNQAIGKTLHIAEVTVKKALQNMFGKLGINNRTALTKLIVEQRAQ